MTLEQRIGRLERHNRRLRFGLVGMFALLGVFAFVGAQRRRASDANVKSVTAEAFLVKDADGKDLGHFANVFGTPELKLQFAKDREIRLFSDEGDPQVSVQYSTGKRVFAVAGKKHVGLASLFNEGRAVVAAGDSPYMSVTDSSGDIVWTSPDP